MLEFGEQRTRISAPNTTLKTKLLAHTIKTKAKVSPSVVCAHRHRNRPKVARGEGGLVERVKGLRITGW